DRQNARGRLRHRFGTLADRSIRESIFPKNYQYEETSVHSLCFVFCGRLFGGNRLRGAGYASACGARGAGNGGDGASVGDGRGGGGFPEGRKRDRRGGGGRADIGSGGRLQFRDRGRMFYCDSSGGWTNRDDRRPGNGARSRASGNVFGGWKRGHVAEPNGSVGFGR